MRRAIALGGLGICLLGTGCGAAAEVGAKMAAAVIEGTMKAAASGSSSSGSTDSQAVSYNTEAKDTPCRMKRNEWHKAVGGSPEDAPAHLRCKPNGDWPDEEAMRTGGSPGL